METRLLVSSLFLIVLASFPIQSYCEEQNQERVEKGCTYVIQVQTGDIRNAGTNARVSLVLRDRYSNQLNITDLQSWGLMSEQWNDYFKRGNLDVFAGRERCLEGPLCSITLSHDNTGFSPSWYVELVDVTTIAPRRGGHCSRLGFPVNSWLAFDEPPYYSTRRGVYLCDGVAGSGSLKQAVENGDEM